jgi:glycosyltransferase involved in cell wall biosynthesis
MAMETPARKSLKCCPLGKIRMLYLTWGEVIVRNGIFRNQVVEQLRLTSQSSDSLELHLLSGMPLVNMKLLKDPSAFWRDVSAFYKKLDAEGIRFSVRMIPAVSAWFYSKRWQFPLYRWFNMGYLKRYVRRYGIDILHCRSYQATYFALLVRKKYRLSYKVIFDTRGLFPEEGLIKHAYRAGDGNFVHCKQVEQYCFSHADAIVNVSETFSEYVRTITDNPNIHTIYTSTNLELFHHDKELGRATRAELGVREGEKVLTYLGDVRTSGWHQVANLVRLFKAFAAVYPVSRLLIITEQDHEGLVTNMAKYGLGAEHLLIRAGKGQARINALLNASDFGCLPFRNVENEVERLLGYTMIASKTGEYLAAGLPVISNQAVGAASALIRQERIGVTYAEEGDVLHFDHTLWQEKGFSDEVRERAVQVAHTLFNAKENAERYVDIYRELTCLP